MTKPIFISYKRVDKDKVFEIKDFIESETGLSCWIDLDGIESDAVFKNVIIKAINTCEVMLFMYSKAHSKIFNYEKDWTVKELNFASKKNKRIVFVNIDGSELTDDFEFDYGTKQQIDALDKTRLQKLVVDLRKWIKVTPPTKKFDHKDQCDHDRKINPEEKCTRASSRIVEDKKQAEYLYQQGYNLYFGANGVTRNIEEAFPYFEQAAQLNHRKAQAQLSKYYILGLGGRSNRATGEYWERQSQLPDNATITPALIPKSLIFEYHGRKFYMVLSEDEKYYLGNLNAKEGDLSWWDNKWIQTIGVGAIYAGAVAFSVVALPIAIALGLKTLGTMFSDDKNKSTGTFTIDSKLCKQLNEKTGYNFSIPFSSELKGVKKDMRNGCIVLRVCNNPQLFSVQQ